MLNTIKNFITGYSTTLYAVAIAIVIGFGSGLYVHGKFDDAKLATQLQNKIKNDTVSIGISNKVEQGIIEEKDAVQIKYVYQTKEIIKYVPETIYRQCKDEQGNSIDTTLNVGAVRVLNDDSTTGIQSTGVGDAEVQASTEIGLRKLSEYILIIKRQYKELAANHDGLVEYNQEYKNLTNQ